MVREYTEYYCGVCGRRYSHKSKAIECESKEPYPPDFKIGDECMIILSDGHKDNAYMCKITGMDLGTWLQGHHYIRLLKIIKKVSNPYKSYYKLNSDDKRLYGPH